MRSATYDGWASVKIVQKSYSFSTNQNEEIIDQLRVLHDKYLFSRAPANPGPAKQWEKEEKWLRELGRELMASNQRIETLEQLSTLKISDCPFEKGLEAWWKARRATAARELRTPKRKLELELIILPGVGYEEVRNFIEAEVKKLEDIVKKRISTPAITSYLKYKAMSSIDSEKIEVWLGQAQAVTQMQLSGVHDSFSKDMKLQCGGSLSRSRKASSKADIFVFDEEWTIEKIRVWILLMQKQGLIVAIFSFTGSDWQLGKENEIFNPEISCPHIFEGTTFCEAGISVAGKVYFGNIAFVEEKSRSSIMLYSHSSLTFMKALFQVGLQHDLILHPTGVYSFEEWKKGGVARRNVGEEDIFSLLGIEWHPPSTRNADFSEDHLSWSGGTTLKDSL
ncbi:hypothetical protein JCM5350_002889 [Sporobolomyces pararoseus]